MLGLWFTRRQEGRKKGQAFNAVFVASCLRALEAERRRETGCRTHTPRMMPKPEQRMKISLDKTNHIGYSSQHFLTLFPESRARNGTRGRSAENRASAHGRRGLGRFCGHEPRTSLKSAHTRPARLSVWQQAEPGAIPAAGSFRAFRYSGKAWGRQNERRSGAWRLWLSRS